MNIPVLELSGGLAVMVAAGWHYTKGYRSRSGLREVATPEPAHHPALSDEKPDSHEGLPGTYVLVSAPMVGDDGCGMSMPLRDWLVHCHPGQDNVWAEVVPDFYTAAAASPSIADYFRDVDASMLQRHFLAALMMLTRHGLTVGAVKQIQARHAHVRNSAGTPITPDIYDAAIGVLTTILARKRVPEDALAQVGVMLATLREAIVVRLAETANR